MTNDFIQAVQKFGQFVLVEYVPVFVGDDVEMHVQYVSDHPTETLANQAAMFATGDTEVLHPTDFMHFQELELLLMD